MSRTDDFPKKVVSNLRLRVAHRCSNPDCRVQTVGPGNGPDDVTHFGQAAHISAASPGGPRFNPHQSSFERRSAANGIWLCANCAKKIDVNTTLFTVELLKEWKLLAENAAREEQGKQLPRKQDPADLLTAVLGGMPTNFALQAIDNVHSAVASTLQSLDPRFQVEISRSPTGTTYSMNSPDRVPIELKLGSAASTSFAAAISNLVDHGESFQVPASEVDLDGSQLVSMLHGIVVQKNGTISINAPSVDCRVMLFLRSPDALVNDFAEDLNGRLTRGRHSLTVEVFGFGGQVTLHFVVKRTGLGTSPITNFNLVADFKVWNGIDVRQMPYFTKLLQLFDRLRSGWILDFGLEIAGEKIFGGVGNLTSGVADVAATYAHLLYVQYARTISSFLGVSVPYVPDYAISIDEMQLVVEVAKTIQGELSYDNTSIANNPTATVAPTDVNGFNAIMAGPDPEYIFRWHESNNVTIFGKLLALPPRQFRLVGVSPVIHDAAASNIDAGSVLVEFVRSEKFRLDISYLPPDGMSPQ